MGLKRVISSGQTGVERAALDTAIKHLVYYWSGYVPRGRLAEDGEMEDSYFDVDRPGCGLTECDRSRTFTARHRNIRDSDATLILRSSTMGTKLPQGVKLIIKTCRKLEKPYRIFDPYKTGKVPAVVRWICETELEGDEPGETRKIHTLNVVGPKESDCQGIYDRTLIFFSDVLSYVSQYENWGIKIWALKHKPTRK